MNGMSVSLDGASAEIEHQHHLAQAHADEAIEHARKAGALLLQVKATLEHGDYLPWLTTNVSFTPRTAQRYMNAATPKPKYDRLSHSPPRPPKPGTKKALLLEQFHAVRHREDVLAHAAYLAGELPSARGLRPSDIDDLVRLRDRLNTILEVAA